MKQNELTNLNWPNSVPKICVLVLEVFGFVGTHMSLADEVLLAAKTLREVSSGLAAALRVAAQKRHASAALVDTFREAESLSITVSAVVDDASRMLALMRPDANVVGRCPALGEPNARVRNGFDSLAMILLKLLTIATDAVSDVATNQSQWLISPLQARQCFEAMSIHHDQLRAIYGIIHLASKVIDLTDVSQSLFVDVAGEAPRPDLEPSLWRNAVKVEPLFGRMFGFHYKTDMRHFLRVVNIARGSITTAATTAPGLTSPLVRHLTALGWGWIYSNMVLLNNMGLPIDGASNIGADSRQRLTGIDEARMYMNLVEDPIFAGVTSLGSADVAMDFVFHIIPSCSTSSSDTAAQEHERMLPPIPVPPQPIPVRIVSHVSRPIDVNLKQNLLSVKSRDNIEIDSEGKEMAHSGEAHLLSIDPKLRNEIDRHQSCDKAAGTSDNLPGGGHEEQVIRVNEINSDARDNVESKAIEPANKDIDSVVRGEMWSWDRNDERQENTTIDPDSRSYVTPNESISDKLDSSSDSRETEVMRGSLSSHGVDSGTPSTASRKSKDRLSLSDTLIHAADGSMLANAIKNELVKIQSNVSQFLCRKEIKPASGLIIHFHGGGFISQSSSGHVVYLKEWAADMPDAVILSVDYRLAPENPYPCALEDCFYAFQWAISNADRIGTKADRVVVCGDSAGGNLAVAVALKARDLGLREPDGIFLAYPALYVNVAWSPSRVLSFFDPLLPLSVLDLCLRSYVPSGEKPYENPYISPLVASPATLRALPPVTIVTGSLDPLLDDSVQFAHKLHVCGRSCDTLRVLESMPHGFLSMIQVSKEARNALRFLRDGMAKCLQLPIRKGAVASEEEQKGVTPLPETSTTLFDI